jgi:hypothetical protein
MYSIFCNNAVITYLHVLNFLFVAELHLPFTYGILGQIGEPSGI